MLLICFNLQLNGHFVYFFRDDGRKPGDMVFIEPKKELEVFLQFMNLFMVACCFANFCDRNTISVADKIPGK